MLGETEEESYTSTSIPCVIIRDSFQWCSSSKSSVSKLVNQDMIQKVCVSFCVFAKKDKTKQNKKTINFSLLLNREINTESWSYHDY